MPRVYSCHHYGCHKLAIAPHYFCNEHLGEEQAFIDKRNKWQRNKNKVHVHEYNVVERKRNNIKREQNDFYHSKQWQGLRKIVLDKQHYICQYCLLNNRTKAANIVDHLVPIVYDTNKKDDVDNLNVICPECHKLKTDWEQSYYFNKGVKQDVDEVTDIKVVNAMMRHSDGDPQTSNS